MEKEWIPVIATLLGVLIGGSISILTKKIELNHQINQENRKQLLQKFEELHQLIYEYPSIVFKYISALTSIKTLLNVEPNKLPATDRFDNSQYEITASLTKIGGLIKIYAPEFYSDYELMSTSSGILTESAPAFVDDKDTEPFLTAQTLIFKTTISLQRKIETKIRKDFFFKEGENLLKTDDKKIGT